ncbi:MAG: hypothetical protein JNK05_38060 [Myxococcales bacterium]|nr:hypothetical protein [Myxococcales bacterium]
MDRRGRMAAWFCVWLSIAACGGCAGGRPPVGVPPGPLGAEPFIVVLGQVNRPDSVPSSAARSLCELVARTGGLTPLACRRVVVDRRVAGRRQRWAFEVDDLRDGGGCGVMLWPGDSVLVGNCGE